MELKLKCEDDYKRKFREESSLNIKKRIGSESSNAKVYIACDDNNNCKYVLKKMPLDKKSIDSLYDTYCIDRDIESEKCNSTNIKLEKVVKYEKDKRVLIHTTWAELYVMNLCKILLDEKITFNLPKTYEYSLCSKCKYDDESDNTKCAMLVTEFANEGDLNTWLKKKHRSPLELFVMFFQIFAGLYVLRKYFNVIHNDLHAGNILVKKVKTSNDSFFKYIIDGKEYYIPNIGYIFIIWDFGYAQIPGFFEISEYKQSRDNDLKKYKSIDVIDYTRITLVIILILKELNKDDYKYFTNFLKYFILKNSQKGIRLENLLNIFENYKKPEKLNLSGSCSFDKKLKNRIAEKLSKYRYERKKQNISSIPQSFLYSKNYETLKKNYQNSNVNIPNLTKKFTDKIKGILKIKPNDGKIIGYIKNKLNKKE